MARQQAKLPYGYYTLLRLVVTGCALALAWFDYQETQGVSIVGAVLIGIGVLFNPIVPVHLSRDIWMPVDLGAAVLFTFMGSWHTASEPIRTWTILHNLSLKPRWAASQWPRRIPTVQEIHAEIASAIAEKLNAFATVQKHKLREVEQVFETSRRALVER